MIEDTEAKSCLSLAVVCLHVILDSVLEIQVMTVSGARGRDW